MSVATDYIITPADVSAVHVEAQPTVLRGSATQNKQVFDKYSDMITSHFNGLCYFISSDTSAEVEMSVLLLYASMGWVQD